MNSIPVTNNKIVTVMSGFLKLPQSKLKIKKKNPQKTKKSTKKPPKPKPTKAHVYRCSSFFNLLPKICHYLDACENRKKKPNRKP